MSSSSCDMKTKRGDLCLNPGFTSECGSYCVLHRKKIASELLKVLYDLEQKFVTRTKWQGESIAMWETFYESYRGKKYNVYKIYDPEGVPAPRQAVTLDSFEAYQEVVLKNFEATELGGPALIVIDNQDAKLIIEQIWKVLFPESQTIISFQEQPKRNW